MKSEPHTSEEFRRFKGLLTGLMAVPHSELKEKMAEYDREKKKRQHSSMMSLSRRLEEVLWKSYVRVKRKII